ncbi:phytanoyl-CoA dioxygenase family protein [Polynucleobacter alcilacus]|uniref:phytanoyl-CoA dioxygenase family protein n=1 Tax=Polynucleobacter alcilacus TaxID=1819739 RepID=UPI001C0D08AD|nr:phytanoyl-CoA dioxygenase family protein [Polynucleobacter alcilacus]MBU3568181.1 phytanoyl-CoA dioxygenase family protein [Polynucleobacter alcilacus]
MAKSNLNLIHSEGFAVIKTEISSLLEAMRSDFIQLFNRISQHHGCGAVHNDADVCRLYENNHSLWVAAYNQLRFHPKVFEIASSKIILDILNNAGLVSPHIGAQCIVRADMPFDDPWRFPPHQDYPFNKGSLNSVTLWVPFQDTGEDMGCLQVIKGSNKLGLLPEKNNEIIEQFPDINYESAPIALGEILCFSQFLIHKSGFNRSEKIRFSLQLRYNDLAHDEYLSRKLTFSREY